MENNTQSPQPEDASTVEPVDIPEPVYELPDSVIVEDGFNEAKDLK